MSTRSEHTTDATRPGRSRRPAFTLIELLVVVAIIALLISILLPSLSKARAQARSSLCATRIAQLVKAMLVYADDFNETPPFMGLGWEDIHYGDEPDGWPDSDAPGDIPTRSEMDWAMLETWLSADHQKLWNGDLPESDWAAEGVGLRTGMLFSYTRFEKLYRCPDFERIASKTQSSFNYARSILGRKWILGKPDDEPIGLTTFIVDDTEPDYHGGSIFGAVGPIVKISQVHAPANAGMMYDEWWMRHIAAPYEEHVPPRDSVVRGGWMANDCMHFPLADELGQYHGSHKKNEFFPDPDFPWERDPQAVKLGMVGYYDGHAGLERQWWVGLTEQTNEGAVWGSLGTAIVPYLSKAIFSVRGRGGMLPH